MTDEEICLIAPSFMKSSGEFKAEETRNKLKGKVAFNRKKIRKYPFKPFDIRKAYLAPEIQPLFSRPSPELLEHAVIEGNCFFITRDTADKAPEGPPFYFSSLVCDYDCISGHARHFPMFLTSNVKSKNDKLNGQNSLLSDDPISNLSQSTREYLGRLKIKNPDAEAKAAKLVWMHALAVGYSPAYLAENADGIRRDWPRIPLPDSRKALEKSAELGYRIAALLDTESEVSGVNRGKIESFLRLVGVPSKVGGGELDPNSDDFAVTAGWGHAGKDGVTMPGKGRIVTRNYDKAELEAIEKSSESQKISAELIISLLGETTCDVFLNDKAFWKNIPINVWEYYIGGYQVIKKWLSYREEALLGRALKTEEAREVMNMARRLGAIVLLQPALDENYKNVKEHAYAWPGSV
ncbi:MAG: type ISP restriction/modification enzyme [Thermoguttaceae bacterium]